MTSEETRKAAERLVKASKCTTLESLHELYGHHPLAFDSIEKTRDAIDRDKEITSGAYLDRLADDEHREREDAEPITEEWGLANGAGRDDGGGIAWKIWERGQEESTEEPAFHILRSQGSLWLECYSATGDTLGLIELMTPPTRGQLRKLLEALKGGET